MLTPGTASAVQNLHGTIYEKVTDATYTYHMHAQPTPEAKLANAVWLIWRENNTTGQIVSPEVNGAPHPDENVGTNPAGLTYWTTA